MYKITNNLVKNPCRTAKYYNVIKRHHTRALFGLRNIKTCNYVYLFSGITVASYITYKSTVKCEEHTINEDVPQQSSDGLEVTKPEKWKLYQYATCPFCCKVRAFLDYYDIDYEKVEVNPLSRKEIKFSEYRKVPFIKSENVQINDSSLIISVLKGRFLGKGDVGTLLSYYPFLEDDEKKGKGKYQNLYNVMYQKGFSHVQNLAIREESKWRRWVDETFVHTLSPNIYRTIGESFQAMEYITTVGNFSAWEQKAIYYSGAFAMYLIGKRVKKKHHLRNDVRQSLYEEANRWTRNVGSKMPFMGGKQPNLADLNMYGVISAIEGLDAFNDLMKNTNIRPWYKRMKAQVTSHRGKEDPDWIELI